MSVILAFDPSIADMGYAVVNQGMVTACGRIKTSPKVELQQRLKSIYQDVKSLIIEYSPEFVAIESQYIDFRKMSGAILKTSEVTGMIKGIVFMSEKKLEIVHPKTLKTLFSLPPRATSKEAKRAAIWYVEQRCKYLQKNLNHNICDAICIGLYTSDKIKSNKSTCSS